jgi:VWFA-related protein
MVMTLRRILLGALAGILCGATALLAQSTAKDNPANSPAPVIKSTTHAVAVDVVVVKGKDDPVAGLRKEDFQVEEDGKTQAIDFFEEHSAPATTASDFAPLPKMPPNVYVNVPLAPQNGSVNLLLLDSLNTPRPDQIYVRQQVLSFLKTMTPGSRIAIFVLGSKLRLVQGFTDDPALLIAALSDKNPGANPTTTNVSRSRKDDQDDKDEVAIRQQNLGATGRSSAGLEALAAYQRSYSTMQSDQRIGLTLDALTILGRYLAAIPGRKNLIWFSSTFPVYLYPKSSEKQPFRTGVDFIREIKATADVLTLSKVAVYPIDAEGMMNDHAMESDHEEAGVGSGLLQNTMNEAAQRSETMSSMEQIASDTGGEAFFNTNDLKSALSRAIDDGSHYYTIVYTPTNKDTNGQFRRIRIKLNQERAKLSYRRGYYATDAKSAMPGPARTAGNGPDAGSSRKSTALSESNPLQPLMDPGMPNASQILYGVRVEPAAAQPAPDAKRAGANPKLTGPTVRYTADFLIDWKMLSLKAAADGNRVGAIEVELTAYDREGVPLNWAGGSIRMTINPETYAAIQRSGVPAHLEIDLPRGKDFLLATGVYDLVTQKAGTLQISLGRADLQAAKSSPSAGPLN